jgi:transcriptional regulator with XRE-family HTH domain
MNVRKERTEEENEFYLSIGSQLIERLKEIGMSKYRACKDSKVSPPTLERILEGRNTYGIDNLFKVCKVSGLMIKLEPYES